VKLVFAIIQVNAFVIHTPSYISCSPFNLLLSQYES